MPRVLIMSSITVHLKSKHRAPHTILRNSHAFNSCHFLSSRPNNDDESDESTRNKPSFSSYFNDVKASLKQQPQQSISHKPLSLSQDPKPINISRGDEIRKNLAQFRTRTAPPDPSDPSPDSLLNSHRFSSAEIYKKTANTPSYDAIRASLQQIKLKHDDKRNARESLSLSKFKESLNSRPKTGSDGVEGATMVIGGTSENLPITVFGKELKEREKKGETMFGGPEGDMLKTEFVRTYAQPELGDKLRKLRPQGVEKKKDWFSLMELNERLAKLRELEENVPKPSSSGLLNSLRDSLSQTAEAERNKRQPYRFDVLSPLGGAPSFMQAPPKENLVEKYFHPDNMSSAEKLKLELKRIRDEFKKHETDCGSAQVQIAILTTEIHHLASVLHKKDKHSRKGLLAKVQKRKSLLKYLRRTDWDSYCVVLSRLGLRDNPDYKN